MPALPDRRSENIAKVACTVAGAVWGLYWIPVRALHDAGIQGLWATAVFYFVPFVLMLPIGLLRWRQIISAGWMMQGIAIIGGLCLVLYLALLPLVVGCQTCISNIHIHCLRAINLI